MLGLIKRNVVIDIDGLLFKYLQGIYRKIRKLKKMRKDSAKMAEPTKIMQRSFEIQIISFTSGKNTGPYILNFELDSDHLTRGNKLLKSKQ